MPGSGSSPGDGPHARRAEWPQPGTTAAWHRVVEQIRVDQKPHERTRADRQGTHHAKTTCAMSVWCFCAMRSSSGLWKTGLCSAGNLRPSHWVPKELYALPKPNQRRSLHAHRQLLSGGWVGGSTCIGCGALRRRTSCPSRGGTGPSYHTVHTYMLTMEKNNDEGNRNENEEGGRVECLNRLG